MFGKTWMMALALLAAGALPAGAARAMTGIPAGGTLAFTVLRDGDRVGSHTLRFKDGGGQVTVNVETSVDVKLPFIGVSVYHFEHQGHEVWRDGALVSLESTTDDDGEAKALKVTRADDALRVQGSAGEHASPGGLIPASLWHPDLVHRDTLLNTLDGKEMKVSVADQGSEEVEVHGTPVTAHHYVVTGELRRDLWYDPQGVLVKIAFAAKDDSHIEYVLR